MIKQLDVYDFDDTLVRSPGYTNKKATEDAYPENQFSTPYSFYDHPSSLCEDTHHIQIIEPIYDFWKQASANAEVKTVLVTHRVESLEESVKNVLDRRGITMDRYFFHGRGKPKFEAIEKMLSEFPTIEKVRVFDDSYEQIFLYLNYFKLIKETGLSLEHEIWAVDKSKVFKVNSIELGEFKKIKLI